MIHPASVAEEETASWGIEEIVVSDRIMIACRRAGIRTLAQLRQSYESGAATAGIGAKASLELAAALEKYDRLCAGTLVFRDLHDLLSSFLSRQELAAVLKAWDMNGKLEASGAQRSSLRAMAAALKISHEHMRQLVSGAKLKLQRRLPRECLRPVIQQIAAAITRKGGAAPIEEIAEDLATVLTPFSARRAIRLLCDCGDSISRIGDLSFAMPHEQAQVLHGRIVALLAQIGEPVAAERVFHEIRSELGLSFPGSGMPLVSAVLKNSKEISSTMEGEFFIPGAAIPRIVKRIMARHAGPVHFAALLKDLNALMIPGMRKGRGYILRTLGRSDLFAREAKGFYSESPRAEGGLTQ